MLQANDERLQNGGPGERRQKASKTQERKEIRTPRLFAGAWAEKECKCKKVIQQT